MVVARRGAVVVGRERTAVNGLLDMPTTTTEARLDAAVGRVHRRHVVAAPQHAAALAVDEHRAVDQLEDGRAAVGLTNRVSGDSLF